MTQQRRSYAGGIIIGGIVIIALSAAYFFLPRNQSDVMVHIGDGVFQTWVEKGSADQSPTANAVAEYPQLSPSSALLIAYNDSGKWPVYMKDVEQPLDIVWLNRQREVVYIVKNAQPDVPPYKAYVPKYSAKYILEVRAGTVDDKSITPRSTASFHDGQLAGRDI